MKFMDEYRNPEDADSLSKAIRQIVTKPWTLMEICGGQTHAIAKFGLEELLPDEITLAHGPGCPVCVTPIEIIDKAIVIAGMENTILCVFGDMMRVPGSSSDLFSAKAKGGDVRIVYSPLDALDIAIRNPERNVVFFAVGFETTAPANAMAVYQAAEKGVQNFFELVSHVLVPPAIEALMSASDNRIQGFLAAGHVCAVMGWEEYIPISEKYTIPIVVTGFEPIDILEGVYMCVKQLEEGRYEVENQYARAVTRPGNQAAREIISKVFEVVPRKWRGIGEIDASGLALRNEYEAFDAEKVFNVQTIEVDEPAECISGLVLRGAKKPNECPAFGKSCTPMSPLGAPMVSNEGACSAYYKYHLMKESV